MACAKNTQLRAPVLADLQCSTLLKFQHQQLLEQEIPGGLRVLEVDPLEEGPGRLLVRMAQQGLESGADKLGGLLAQGLDLAQARHQRQLLLGEVGAERIGGQQAFVRKRCQGLLQALGRIVAGLKRYAVIPFQLAVVLGKLEQLLLEA